LTGLPTMQYKNQTSRHNEIPAVNVTIAYIQTKLLIKVYRLLKIADTLYTNHIHYYFYTGLLNSLE